MLAGETEQVSWCTPKLARDLVEFNIPISLNDCRREHK